MTITTTTRLGLTKDSGDENYSVTRVNANTDKLDDAIGCTPCTSGARPSSGLFDGRIAYETDTDAAIVYRTAITNWRYLGTPAVASQAARDALTPKHDGLKCYRKDLDLVEVYNGSTWLSPSRAGRRLLRGVILETGYSGLAGTETTLSRFTLTPVDFVNGERFIVCFDAYVNAGTGSYVFRVYRNGAFVLDRMYRCNSASLDDHFGFQAVYPCDVTQLGVPMTITVQRVDGAGTLSISGSGTKRSNFSVLQDVDTASNWSISA